MGWRGLLVGSVCGGLLASEALCGAPVATCKNQVQVAREHGVLAAQRQMLVVTPFAVPVAQPVAVVQFPQVFYAAGADAARGIVRSKTADVANDVAAESDEAVVSDERSMETRTESVSWVTQTCVRCHGGPTAEGGFDLSRPEQLSAAERLLAIQRVVSDDPAVRMPPAGGLEPATLGALVQELVEAKGGP